MVPLPSNLSRQASALLEDPRLVYSTDNIQHDAFVHSNPRAECNIIGINDIRSQQLWMSYVLAKGSKKLAEELKIYLLPTQRALETQINRVKSERKSCLPFISEYVIPLKLGFFKNSAKLVFSLNVIATALFCVEILGSYVERKQTIIFF